jgi:hypothetical protein
MKKFCLCLILILSTCTLTGCLSPLTSRMDAMNAQLVHMSKQLDDANRRLESVEKATTKMARLIP